MEVWKGQIKSPRGLITRIDMKNRSAKVLVCEADDPLRLSCDAPANAPSDQPNFAMATPPGQERILTPSTFDGRCPNCLHVLT